MRVQKVGAEWRIFVIAAGAPRGAATAADCGLLAVGAIEGKTFQGEIKYIFDNTDSNAALDYLKGGNSKPNDIDVEAGHKITITFAPQSATLRDDQGDISAAGCTEHHGLFGRFTERRKRELVCRRCVRTRQSVASEHSEVCVAVVSPTKDRLRDNVSEPLDRACAGCVFAKRKVRPHLIIVAGVFRKNAPKVIFVEHDHVVRTFAPRRTDQALN